LGHTQEYDTRVIPLRTKTPVVEAVDDELHVPKSDGLAPGEFDTGQVAAISDNGGFR
jgi:hypothetical protein